MILSGDATVGICSTQLWNVLAGGNVGHILLCWRRLAILQFSLSVSLSATDTQFCGHFCLQSRPTCCWSSSRRTVYLLALFTEKNVRCVDFVVFEWLMCGGKKKVWGRCVCVCVGGGGGRTHSEYSVCWRGGVETVCVICIMFSFSNTKIHQHPTEIVFKAT